MVNRFILLFGAVVVAGCAKSSGAGSDVVPDGGTDNGFKDGATSSTRCDDAVAASSSVGCDYYAVHMDGAFAASNGCFAVFLANTSDIPSLVKVSFAGADVDLATHAKLPRGSGTSLTYADYDPTAGIPPGDVAILFLAGPPTTGTPRDQNNFNIPMECPVVPAKSALTQVSGTGKGAAFHVQTTAPVVAYQMLPYGGGSAAVTGGTLLLPTNVYGTNYIATGAYDAANGVMGGGSPSMNLVASQDNTTITILPKVDINAGGIIAGASANKPASYVLNAGEQIQLTQSGDLAGSPVQSDKPIALFAGVPCFSVPLAHPYCDHSEQQIPSVQQMGHQYSAVPYRQRSSAPENPPWRILGAVNGTRLTYSASVGGPTVINQGDVVEFATDTPFVVSSQDADHPFMLLGYMTGASTVPDAVLGEGYGDPDFVRHVSTDQYMSRYVFFTDPTYPETNLVVTRQRNMGAMADVTLDCAGTLTGWQPLDADHDFTRIDLVRHDFQPQGGCDNGRHEMTSTSPFGLTIWGWGTPETKTFTGYVSYGYPAGQNAGQLTKVTVPVVPN